MVVALEVVECLVLVGAHHIRDVLLRVDIADLGFRRLQAQAVADRLDEVGLAEADTAVDEERVVGGPGPFGNLGGCSARKLVGLAGDERLEGEAGIESGDLTAARLGVAVLYAGRDRRWPGLGHFFLGEDELDLDIAPEMLPRELLDARE